MHSLVLYLGSFSDPESRLRDLVESCVSESQALSLKTARAGGLMQFWPIPSSAIDEIRVRLEEAKAANPALLGYELLEASVAPPLFN